MMKGVKMTFKKANHYLREGKTKEALKEYQKIENTSPLYDQAQFNIALIKQDLDSIKLKKSQQLTLDRAASTSGNLLSSNIKPLVSVVMPVFNVAPYLDASIMSVLNQTYENIELIIVDDASTDSGMNIIRMYEHQDSRIKVIPLEFNTLGGAGIPSNIGIDAAKGKYIAFADSDDILNREAIVSLVQAAEDNDAEVVIADFCNFYDDTRVIEASYDKARWSGLPLNATIKPKNYPSMLSISPVPWRKLYRNDFLEKYKIRYPEGDYFYEDNPLHWFVLSKANKVVFIDKIVAYHRMAREGQTMGADKYKLAAHFCHINSVLHFFNNSSEPMNHVLWEELLKRALNCKWVISRIDDEKVKRTFEKRYAQLVEDVLNSANFPQKFINKTFPNSQNKLESYNESRPQTDLSIIIPVYNCEDLLRGNLSPLTEFTKINVEVLMIDDGSTDGSLQICQEYASNNPNFYIFTQKNKGAGVARNALIPLAIGRYTYFLDADDTIDVQELENAYIKANSNSNDLLLFKYKIEFYEQKHLKEMFNSDKKVWKELLAAKDNESRKRAAAKLINYPWNRIILTKLLHDENIFFGKTVVHNDVPYHWHSIVAAKNIGVHDKAVCNHRKFEVREQITNIQDDRRMMVLEAYRYTNHLISEYSDYHNLFPAWKDFITHLLSWAENKIPEHLKQDYKRKKSDILKQLDKKIIKTNYAPRTGSASVDDGIGFYRIIGNSISGLHVNDQSLGSLSHIVNHESDFEGVNKYFVLNRIIDKDIKNKLIQYLEANNLKYLVIDFDIDVFKSIGYDLTTMPTSYYWFEKKSDWHNLICNTAVRRLKNAYLMNNNGARNFALNHGKTNHHWTMPWDGNCFMSDESFKGLREAFDSTTAKYILTPMERVTDNNQIDKYSQITNGVEEPQISFRVDALESFNEEMVYGAQSKVELFKRLGYEGPWDKLVNLYPWKRKLEFDLSKEAGDFTVASGVFRLHSGNSKAAVDGRTRSHTRARGTTENIDSVEATYVKEQLSVGKYHSKILSLIYNIRPEQELKEVYDKVMVVKDKDINECNTEEKVLIALYSYFNKTLSKEQVAEYNKDQLKLKVNPNLENIYKFKAVINEQLTLMILQLFFGEIDSAIQTKVNITMLLYHYYSSLNKETYTVIKYVERVIELIKMIFIEIFIYDVDVDLKRAKVLS